MNDKELANKIVALLEERWENLEDYEKFKVIDEDEWTQDYKYQVSNPIVEYDGKLYQLCMSRSGSYHTDWYYNPTNVYEVIAETKEVTIVQTEYKTVRGLGYVDHD